MEEVQWDGNAQEYTNGLTMFLMERVGRIHEYVGVRKRGAALIKLLMYLGMWKLASLRRKRTRVYQGKPRQTPLILHLNEPIEGANDREPPGFLRHW